MLGGQSLESKKKENVFASCGSPCTQLHGEAPVLLGHAQAECGLQAGNKQLVGLRIQQFLIVQ